MRHEFDVLFLKKNLCLIRVDLWAIIHAKFYFFVKNGKRGVVGFEQVLSDRP
jgi:hypothetical protein